MTRSLVASLTALVTLVALASLGVPLIALISSVL
jgi:hypothetical protein